MDPLETNQQEGQESTRNDGANPSYEATMARMMDYIENQGTWLEKYQNLSQRKELSNPEIPDDQALERFQKFHPPRFDGEIGKENAEQWMEAMDKIYAVLRYTDERKVNFGVFQLEGPAEAWWRIVEQKWEQTGTPRTWHTFLEEFKTKFIPLVVRERKEEEFIYLKQGTMTVAQYETKFTKLSKYASEMVNTEAKRKRRFLQGLDLKIQDPLITARFDTYAELVEYAQRVEDSKTRLRELKKSKKKNSKEERSVMPKRMDPPRKELREVSRKRLKESDSPASTKRTMSRMHCQYCDREGHEEDDCWKKMGKCLLCGDSGHRVKFCPRSRERSNKPSLSPRPGN